MQNFPPPTAPPTHKNKQTTKRKKYTQHNIFKSFNGYHIGFRQGKNTIPFLRVSCPTPRYVLSKDRAGERTLQGLLFHSLTRGGGELYSITGFSRDKQVWVRSLGEIVKSLCSQYFQGLISIAVRYLDFGVGTIVVIMLVML